MKNKDAERVVLQDIRFLEKLLERYNDFLVAVNRISELGGRIEYVNSHFHNVFLHQPGPPSCYFDLDGVHYYCDNSKDANAQGKDDSVIDLKTGRRKKSR